MSCPKESRCPSYILWKYIIEKFISNICKLCMDECVLISRMEIVYTRRNSSREQLRNLHYYHYLSIALSISRCSRLDDRRHSICQNTFQKIAKPCSKLRHLLPSTRGNVHERSLRNNNQLSFPKCRTERFKNSFIPAMCYSQVDV